MGRYCPLCQTEVPSGLHGVDLECGHRVHTMCMDQQNPNFEKCSESCQGAQKDVPNEPTKYNGHDYVENPKPLSFFAVCRQALRGSTLYKLLESKTPIPSLVRDHHYGLQRCLAEGVDMDDFLSNGYTYQDLKHFQDFQTRLPQALFALRCTAEHLRDHPEKLPVVEMKLTPAHICEYLGLVFEDHSDQPVVVDGKNDASWTATQLADLGLTFGDFIKANMKYVDQYASLMPTDEDDRRLGVTNGVLDRIPLRPKLEEPKPVVVEPKASIPIRQTPLVKTRHYLPPPVKSFPSIHKTHSLKK